MKTYVLVGAGSRGSEMYARPLAGKFSHCGRLAGVYDTNAGRAAALANDCGTRAFGSFEDMLNETKPDTVIVTTVDRFHGEYAAKAMRAGCDVIIEKPMAADAAGCRLILAAERETGRKVTVTFNCRYMPYMSRIKELIASGAVGRVLSVDLEWYLDQRHGADYFRRWHRRLENCGGLLVHKATHHFDLVNWWLDDEPETVHAFGSLRFYGPRRAERGERCRTCAHKDTCEFYFDLERVPALRKLYLEHEHLDGYYRDRCVFADEIDIYDTACLNVRYRNGAALSYSLVAYSPYEGWRATVTGTDGRMELEETFSGIGADGSSERILLYARDGGRVIYEVPKGTGEHGGGDEVLQKALFAGGVPDPLGRMAGSRAGAMSVLIGAAANLSIAEGIPIPIAQLLSGR